MPKPIPDSPVESAAWSGAELANPHGHAEKALKVRRMFAAIAGSYDLNNRVHSLWRDQAPLGWNVEDPGPVADAICFLLSDYARAISGEIVHVDGGFHAVGASSQE